jgi:hypothetical protein
MMTGATSLARVSDLRGHLYLASRFLACGVEEVSRIRSLVELVSPFSAALIMSNASFAFSWRSAWLLHWASAAPSAS